MSDIDKYRIPRCIESSPQVFGVSIKTAVISLGLLLLAIISITQSILLSLVCLVAIYMVFKYKKGGKMDVFIHKALEKREDVQVDFRIHEIIEDSEYKMDI